MKVLISTILIFVMIANPVFGQRLRDREENIDPTNFEIRICVPNEFENPKFLVSQSTFEGNWAYQTPTMQVHNIKDVTTYGVTERKCAGNTYGRIDISCKFIPGVTYTFSVLPNGDCQECVNRFKKDWVQKYPDTAKKLLRDHGVYTLGLSTNGNHRAFLVSDPDRLLNFDQKTLEAAEKNHSNYGYATFRPDFGKKIHIKCVSVPGVGRSGAGENDSWMNIHNPFEDIHKLGFYQEIANGAYSFNLGQKVIGSANKFLLSNSQSDPNYKTIFCGSGHYSNLDQKNFKLSNAEYKVIDVIEGASTLSPPKTHPVLGKIPNGFRAIVLQGGNGVSRIISFAGTDDPSDLVDDLEQGIPVFRWPWERKDLKFDPKIPYGSLAYEAPDSDRVSSQYSFALKVTKYVLNDGKLPLFNTISLPVSQRFLSDKYVVCGHSLGGGMANYVSGMLGIRGYGFNSAALASGAQVVKASGVPFPDLYFTHVRSSLDPISIVTPKLPSGELIGDQIIVGSNTYVRFVLDHLILNMNVEKIIDYIPPPSAENYRTGK